MIKILFLSENRTSHPDCMAEHGLAIYIETNGRRLLFDAGASDLLVKNAQQLDVNLEEVDDVIISHGHYDHTQGLPAFCKINQKAKIYIHRNSFKKTYGFDKGKLDQEHCGVRWTRWEYEEIKDRLIFTEGPLKLSENILVSGTIPPVEGYHPTEKFYSKGENGELIPDPMDHEQFLAVRNVDENGNAKGICLFSGCSHTGVVPCLRYAGKLFPDERITTFIAGMHLYNADKETREKTLSQVCAQKIDRVIPVHCTGIQAICDLKVLMGDHCIPAGVGDSFEF